MAASANLVPNSLPNWHSKSCATKIFFPLIFFACNCRYEMYDDGWYDDTWIDADTDYPEDMQGEEDFA